jgi:hypothetical protein
MGSVGTRPIGGILVGVIGEHIGPRAGMAFCGCMAALGLVLWYIIGHGEAAPAAAGTVIHEVEPAPAPAA